MYTLNVTNNYFQQVGGHVVPVPDGGYRAWSVAPNGGKESIGPLGSFELTVPSMGTILFIDLGNAKLSQYTNPNIPWTNQTWGGLIRYRGEEAYFRYEGGGVVNLVVDQYGSINVSFPMGGMQVRLNDLTVS
jgi:hypothetical protein